MFLCFYKQPAKHQSGKSSRDSTEDQNVRISFISIGKGIEDSAFKEEGQHL